MSELLIGTEAGIYRLEKGSGCVGQQESPLSVKFLASSVRGLFALTKEGALWAQTTEASWQLINEHPVDEEIWSFAADPQLPGRLYLGVSPALLYRSDDGGKSWTACDAIRRIPGYERWTFPPPPHIPHVRSIAPDLRGTGAVYIGVEEGGVYRSDDGGETWESLNDGLYWDIHTVVLAPAGSELYATTGRGFYRSDNGGRSWQHSMIGLNHRYTVPCVAAARQPGRLYTAAAAGPPGGWSSGVNAALYRTDDSGQHWVRLERGLPFQFQEMVWSIALDDSQRVYAAVGGALFVSRDEGETWELATDSLPTIRSLALIPN